MRATSQQGPQLVSGVRRVCLAVDECPFEGHATIGACHVIATSIHELYVAMVRVRGAKEGEDEDALPARG